MAEIGGNELISPIDFIYAQTTNKISKLVNK